VAPRRLALAAAFLALAGCGGGGGGDAKPAANCSDRTFRAQDEELYVAQTTIQNALAAPGGTQAAAQLRQGARLLRTYVDAHPPCGDELRDAADLEQDALDGVDDAAAKLADDPSSAEARTALESALADLREAGRMINPVALPEGG
jgi:hypothetical protein